MYNPKRFIIGLKELLKDQKNELERGKENLSEVLKRMDRNPHSKHKNTFNETPTLHIKKKTSSSHYMSLKKMPINKFAMRTGINKYLIFRKTSNIFIFYNKSRNGTYIEGPKVKSNSAVWKHTDFYITKQHIHTISRNDHDMEKKEEYEDRVWNREMSDIIGQDQSW